MELQIRKSAWRSQTGPIDLDDILDGSDWKSTSDTSSADDRASPNAVSSPSLFDSPFAHSPPDEEIHLSFFSEWLARSTNTDDETIDNKDDEQPLIQRNAVAHYEHPLRQHADSLANNPRKSHISSPPRSSSRYRMFFNGTRLLRKRMGHTNDKKDTDPSSSVRKRGLFSRRRLDKASGVLHEQSNNHNYKERVSASPTSSVANNEITPLAASFEPTHHVGSLGDCHTLDELQGRESGALISFDRECEFSFDCSTPVKDSDDATLRVSNSGVKLGPPEPVRDHPSFDSSLVDRIDLFDLLYDDPTDGSRRDHESDLRQVMVRLNDPELESSGIIEQDSSQGPMSEDRVVSVEMARLTETPDGTRDQGSAVPLHDLRVCDDQHEWTDTTTKFEFPNQLVEIKDNFVSRVSLLRDRFERRSDAYNEESFSLSVGSIDRSTQREVAVEPTVRKLRQHFEDQNTIHSSMSSQSSRLNAAETSLTQTNGDCKEFAETRQKVDKGKLTKDPILSIFSGSDANSDDSVKKLRSEQTFNNAKLQDNSTVLDARKEEKAITVSVGDGHANAYVLEQHPSAHVDKNRSNKFDQDRSYEQEESVNITNSTFSTYGSDEDHYRMGLLKCHLHIKDIKIHSLECKIEAMLKMSQQDRSAYEMHMHDLKIGADCLQTRQNLILEQLRIGIDSKDKVIMKLTESVASMETELAYHRQNGSVAIHTSLEEQLSVQRQRCLDVQQKYDQICKDHDKEILEMQRSHQQTVKELQIELDYRHSCIQSLSGELCKTEVKLEQVEEALAIEKQNALLVSRYKEQRILEIEESHVAELAELCQKLESRELANKMLTTQVIALETSMGHFCNMSDISN